LQEGEVAQLAQWPDDREIEFRLPADARDLSPIQNIYTGSGAQPASYSIAGPLPVKKASNFLFSPSDAMLRMGGSVHWLLHILHGVLRDNFTWYVADLVCLSEVHRRTTSFPQGDQEPTNSPYQNQIRNQGWIETEGVVGVWEGGEGKAGWPTTTIPLGLLRDSDPHFRVPVVATSPSTSFKQLKPLKAYRLIGEC